MAEHDLQNPSIELLLTAYVQGAFPMVDPDTRRLEWYSPERRGVIPIAEDDACSFHIPKSLAREIRKNRFDITTDRAFERVMRECATDRAPWNQTWIDERLIRTYTKLYGAGFAHSIEAWHEGDLIGGLYGVHLGAAFFGESMFSRPERGGTNASKICLVHLVRHLQSRGFTLLDTQFWNEHLAQFGCIEIARDEYMQRLDAAVKRADVMWQDER